MARKVDPIQKVVLASGKVRWRFTIDHDRNPDGSRRQKRYTYDTKKEAQAKRAEIIASKANGTYVAPTNLTVAQYLASWLAGKRNLRAGTRRTYLDALKPVSERLGDVELQKLTKAQLDGLVDWMLTSGRRIGKSTTGLSPRSVNSMLTVLTGALKSAEKQGLIGRNVAALVERPSQERREMKTWTAEQASAFLAATASDRLAVAWCLSMYGLRRGEVLGLRWDDVDLEAGTLTISRARVTIAGHIVEEAPKTERGRRTLPLDPSLVATFRRHRVAQAAEKLEAGPSHETQGYVVADELGRPYQPTWYGHRFARLAREAGLPVIRLHDARHTTGTLMHLRGVPTAVISAWLGHASAAFTMRTYVHSQDEALRAAGATLTGALWAV